MNYISKSKNSIEEEDYNSLPFTLALRVDKRNFFSIYISIFKMKIEIIAILFYPDKFTHKSLTLSIYILDIYLGYFMNALLYNDDVVSQKYHNNGKLDLIVSIFLSLVSNIISCLIIWAIKLLSSYNNYFILMVKEIRTEHAFNLTFGKYHKLVKIKGLLFFFINFIFCFCITYYLFIFCQIYKKSQVSLLINYLIGLLQSIIFSIIISLIISFLRFLGLKFKKKSIYRTSVYLNEHL